jgi:uncharacterized protein YecE (DUF72 family)
MTGQLRVGCSGWSYRDWRGVVYPDGLPARRWFEHYVTLFDTVELNSTFYRLPAATTVTKWAEQAPDAFVYAAKVGQFGTHRMKLRDPAGWLARHLERIELLGPSLGPMVVQLPPRWKRNTRRLDEFLSIAPRRHRWAVELRDPSWVHPETMDVLRAHDAALVWHDLLPEQPCERTASWVYVRFHGPNAVEDRYRGRYGEAGLAPWIARLRPVLEDGADVFAYFNNDYDGHAVVDATNLRDALRSARP